ncbi:hypothetical protein EV191_1322 [Tamaricihabitans halophyticus]|uniref:Uncharacterized protein n=1 Tax=Tamaricihabitans halophyticus TaxID=1262583 RepID=A0A4R2PT50_9PSEU|nr:hypothetical protein [Tamaricihabitans halophyticus]TCP39162.1 hypothetical protein EV191_1322 [Tamaricihabitans halophyticus]
MIPSNVRCRFITTMRRDRCGEESRGSRRVARACAQTRRLAFERGGELCYLRDDAVAFGLEHGSLVIGGGVGVDTRKQMV